MVEDKKELKLFVNKGKLFLLIKLLKERSKKSENPAVKHNLLVRALAYDALLCKPIDTLIDELNQK